MRHTGSQSQSNRDARRRVWLSLLAALLLAGCASAPARAPSDEVNEVLFGAINLVGTPYHFGGNTPQSGFDCSGLVRYVYRTAVGLLLPRTSHGISEIDAPRVKRDELSAGDLLFFHGRSKRVDHVGIYVGNGRFVHAPTTGGKVRLDELASSYWSRHFLFARRPLVK